MYKKRIIIVFCTIVVYIILNYIYSKVVNQKLSNVYVIKNDIKRGEKITLENTYKLKIDAIENKNLYKKNIENLVAKFDLKEGQIINSNNVLTTSEYLNVQDNNEIIVIDLYNLKSDTNINLEAGSVINLYYTGKSNQIENFFNNSKYKKIKSSNVSDNYTTVLLLENCIIKEVYDSNGVVTDNKNKVHKIALEVENNLAMMIENIKNYGNFNVTIKR